MEDISASQIFLFIAVSIFGFIIRLPFAIWKTGIAGDNMGGFSKIYGLSQKTFIRYDIHDAANGEGYFPRPALFHYLVSRFPKKLWRFTAVFLNIFFDILTGWIVFGMTIYLIYDGKNAVDMSLLSMIVFYTSPLLLPVTARLKATNNRTMGLFFATCFFIAFYLSLDNPYYYIALILFAYLCIIGSTFALQAILFFTPLLCLCLGNFVPLAILIVSIAVLWFLPFTGVKGILIFKWKHILMYNRNLKTSNSTKSRKLLINTLLLFFAPNGLTKKLRLFLYDAPLTILLYSVPFIPILFVLVFKHPYVTSFSFYLFKIEAVGYCFAMLCCACTLFFITSVGKGKIFGESERYFEFALPFLVAFFVAFSSEVYENIFIVFAIVFAQIGITVLIHFLSMNHAIPSILYFKQNKEVDEIVDWLSKNTPQAKIATIPIRFGRALSSQQLYTENVRCKFYYQMIMDQSNLKDGFREFENEVYKKSLLNISPSELHLKYGIDLMIVKDDLIIGKHSEYLEHFKDNNPAFQTGGFSIYRVK